MIKIKYDCPESNSEMVKTECGFYCSSCSQDVYDFTESSSHEIAQIKRNNPSITCGVFTNEQAVINVRSKVQNIFRLAFAAIFVLGLNITSLFGQEANMESSAIVTEISVSNENIFITGTLKSEKGKQLEGWVSYYFGEESYSINTDADGNFSIELPKEALGQKLTMSFSAGGYHLKQVELELKTAKCYTYQIELKKYKRPLLRRNQIRGRF
jgi:hypothetical protein